MDINQPLDQAQIADAVNRQKVGTQRQRNEMMRLGTSDPNSFAMQNQKQLQDAQQPAEFWGAGRKIAEDQAPDLDAANMINPLVKLGGVYNYYGDTDSSSAKWGTPYGKTDIGGGKYNILGSQGQNLGTGYKSLQESIGELYKNANTPTAVSKWKDYTGSVDQFYDLYYDPESSNTTQRLNTQKFNDAGYRLNPNYQPVISDEYGVRSMDASGSQYQKMFNGYDWKGSDYDTLDQANAARDATASNYYTGNNIRDWETLGQLLTQGNITGNYDQRNSFGGNQIADRISGLNTLYGSTPLIFKDQLYGYKNAMGDTTPLKSEWNDQWTTTGKYDRTQHWDLGNVGMGRRYENPDWWSQNTKRLGDGGYFVSKDKIAENPGWSNEDYYNRTVGENQQSTKGGGKTGLLGGFFKAVDPILDKIDPMHNKVQTWTTGSSDTEGQMPYFQKIAPMILNYFLPGVGSAVSAVDSGTRGDWGGAVSGALGSYLNMTGGIDTGYGDLANTAATGAITGGLQAALSNNPTADSTLQAALLGGAGGLAGGVTTNATSGLGQGLSNFFGGAAQGAVSSAGKGSNAVINSALSSGVGRGLGGLFNQVSGETNQQKQKQNIQTGQQAVKLAQIFRNNNGGKTTTGRKT